MMCAEVYIHRSSFGSVFLQYVHKHVSQVLTTHSRFYHGRRATVPLLLGGGVGLCQVLLVFLIPPFYAQLIWFWAETRAKDPLQIRLLCVVRYTELKLVQQT